MLAELIQDLDRETWNNLEREERFITSEVSWQQYEALLVKLEDNCYYRVTYLDGVLEILSPSRRHEGAKKRIATLLEVYFEETDTEYFPLAYSSENVIAFSLVKLVGHCTFPSPIQLKSPFPSQEAREARIYPGWLKLLSKEGKRIEAIK